MINRVSFTGHRDSKLPFFGNDDPSFTNFKTLLYEEILRLAQDGAREFFSGMALGVDTYAAQAVLKAQEQIPDIRLIAVVPCRNQDKFWSEEQKQRYHEILSRCSRIITVSESYSNGCMQKRNRLLVDLCDILVAAYDGTPGGTQYTIEYAKRKGRQVVLIPLIQ